MNAEAPLISVIIPVYNVEKYIGRCLDSLRNQTVHNFEAILIDDGSTDSSGTICEKYSQMDERFQVRHVTNSGVSSARNLGLSCATGKYIAFIDSDDAVESNYLELLVEQSEDADLVIMGVKFVNADSTLDRVEQYESRRVDLIPSYAHEVFKDSSYHFVYAKRYKRLLLEENSIKFDTSLSMGEDTLFVLHYLKCCNHVLTIEGTPYHYYRYGGGTLSSRRLDTYERVDAANEKIAVFLDEWSSGAACTPEMKRRFWLSFYYASFYILQDSTHSFCTKLVRLKETFRRTKTRLTTADIWSLTHMEAPVFRVLLTLRNPVLLLFFYQIISVVSGARRNS